MGVPTSEVGYTPAMPRREDHEVHKGHVVALGEEKKIRNGANHCMSTTDMHFDREYRTHAESSWK